MLIPFDVKMLTQRQQARLVANSGNIFEFSDGKAKGWQSVAIGHRDLAWASVRLSLNFRPGTEGDASLVLHHVLGTELFRVGRDGTVAATHPELVSSCTCKPAGDGWFQIDAVFANQAPSLQLGLARANGNYAGSGKIQFELRDIVIDVLELRWRPSPGDALRLVESGMRCMTDPAWKYFADGLEVAAFAHDPRQAEALRAELPEAQGHAVLARALSDRNGAVPMHVTQAPAASSIFKPDAARLRGTPAAKDHEIVSESRIETVRFDALLKQKLVQQPEVIRVRAPGMEYNVLRGFGDALDAVLAVEVPLYLYPIYRRQKLLGDIVDLLESSGLVLRRTVPPTTPVQASFGGMQHMVTGQFMRQRPGAAMLPRMRIIEEIWGLPPAG